MPQRVELKPFVPEHLPLVEPWFDHPEVRRRLGGRDWPAREFRLLEETPGTEYRGRLVTGRDDFVAFDGADAVALVVTESYDRWTTYGGQGPDGPIVLAAIDLPAMDIAFVVDPGRWSRGYGRTTVRAVIEDPAFQYIRVFGAGVEPDNEASIRCLRAAGFRSTSDEPDWEGMLHFVLER